MSDNLGLSQVAENQDNKETTLNTQAGQLDAALTDIVEISVTGASSPVALSSADSVRRMVLKFTGTHPGGTLNYTVPTNKKLYVVWNSGTGGAITLKTVSGSGVSVANDTVAVLFCDGTNVVSIVEPTASITSLDDIGDVNIDEYIAEHHQLVWDDASQEWVNLAIPYELGIFIPGVVDDNTRVFGFVFTRSVDFPSGLTGSEGHAFAAPAADDTWDIKKNGSKIGEVNFEAPYNEVSFTFGSAQSFADGDRLEIVSGYPADDTLADVALTLKGTRKS